MATLQNSVNLRRLPVGTELIPEGVHFRVWAPKRKQVEVVLNGSTEGFPLEAEDGGYFSGVVAEAKVGSLYRFRLDGGEQGYPDPASRFQPEGPHGPSEVVDPKQFQWSDEGWKGAKLPGQVLYELHIGTFTPEGTFSAAAEKLEHLANTGVTMVELMPIADFPGTFGWGYDGVNFYAPSRLYGTPDDLRRLVDRAHALGIGVILDVVYNHFGPAGNYLRQFSDDYFSEEYVNEWGDALNFDGENSEHTRPFYTWNAAYWIDEFHMDGLRLDATQQIYDKSPKHILAEVSEAARRAAGKRSIVLFAENEEQVPRLARPVDAGGYGIDSLWNDDFHHSAIVALTGHREAYYTDYNGSPQEFISAVKYGYLYQGQWYSWQKQRRGRPGLDLKQPTFLTYLENHDQIANSGLGGRLHQQSSVGRFRAMTAFLLLGPNTPMLFQGQEFSSSKPFRYFADHEPDLGKMVREGRAKFMEQFRAMATPEAQASLPDPTLPEVFAGCKLDWSEKETNHAIWELHRDLLRLRREDPILCLQAADGIDGAVLSQQCFLLRFFGETEDRLLLVNLGPDVWLRSPSEPLMAAPEDKRWEIYWSSEDVRYGGVGMAQVDTDDGWRIRGESAVLLIPTAIQNQTRH